MTNAESRISQSYLHARELRRGIGDIFNPTPNSSAYGDRGPNRHVNPSDENLRKNGAHLKSFAHLSIDERFSQPINAQSRNRSNFVSLPSIGSLKKQETKENKSELFKDFGTHFRKRSYYKGVQ